MAKFCPVCGSHATPATTTRPLASTATAPASSPIGPGRSVNTVPSPPKLTSGAAARQVAGDRDLVPVLSRARLAGDDDPAVGGDGQVGDDLVVVAEVGDDEASVAERPVERAVGPVARDEGVIAAGDGAIGCAGHRLVRDAGDEDAAVAVEGNGRDAFRAAAVVGGAQVGDDDAPAAERRSSEPSWL